jgi:hypothetical protein
VWEDVDTSEKSASLYDSFGLTPVWITGDATDNGNSLGNESAAVLVLFRVFRERSRHKPAFQKALASLLMFLFPCLLLRIIPGLAISLHSREPVGKANAGKGRLFSAACYRCLSDRSPRRRTKGCILVLLLLNGTCRRSLSCLLQLSVNVQPSANFLENDS